MQNEEQNPILIRGAGDLASGVALALHREDYKVVMSETQAPLAVRLGVAFAQAVYSGEHCIKGVKALRCEPEELAAIIAAGHVAVVVDPHLEALGRLPWLAVVDGRMRKQNEAYDLAKGPKLIGLGPGFDAGVNCHAAIETNRGPELGRVFLSGAPQADTGIPTIVEGHGRERVLYSQNAGAFKPRVAIGDLVEAGQALAEIGDGVLRAPFKGVIRGMLHPQDHIPIGMKVGDIDPRLDPKLAWEPSDKAMAAGEAVLKALLALGLRDASN